MLWIHYRKYRKQINIKKEKGEIIFIFFWIKYSWCIYSSLMNTADNLTVFLEK